ncbi:MAG: phosphate signaling complex protein PhoU [Candidatus Coatesbacteria bacterium]
MERHVEEIEAELVRRLLAMGGLVEEMIRVGVAALVEGRSDRLPEIHRSEEQVNGLHLEVDERILSLIARFQPAASDLRFVMAASRMNADLERVGDQAVNVAQNTQAMLALAPGDRLLLDVPRMAELAIAMLRDALDAFARRDAALADTVIRRDDEEDRLKKESLYELVRLMQADVSNVPGGVALLLIARNLERIGDHATNIAEEVIFMVQGRDIRHPGQTAGAGEGL